MSALYNHYYFNEPEVLERQRFYEEKQLNDAWELYELEQANMLVEEPETIFIVNGQNLEQ